MNAPLATAPRPRARSSGHALAVLCLAQFIVALDYSIIYVALPSIGADINFNPALLQWVVSAYAVLFAGLLLVGGRVADRFGAKRVFIAAIVLFGLASALGGVATDGTTLLLARGLQGLAAAFLQPSILALMSAIFVTGANRAKAVSIWGAVGASGLTVGVVLGGILTSLSWRWTFLINVPLAALCVVGAMTWFRSHPRHSGSVRIPFVAAALGTGALLGTVVTLTLLASARDSWPILFLVLALTCASIAGFLIAERVSSNVLITKTLRRIPTLKLGSAATYLYMASVGSEFYLVTLLLQRLESFTPLEAGLGFLPLAVLVTVGNIAAGRMVRRFGAGGTLMFGFAISVVGLGSLALSLGTGNYASSLLPGLILSGFGHGVIYTSMFVIGTRDVPVELQGTSGALLTTSQYLSAAITVAMLTIVLGSNPDAQSFRYAFFVTALAALVGLVVGYAAHRHEQARGSAKAIN